MSVTTGYCFIRSMLVRWSFGAGLLAAAALASAAPFAYLADRGQNNFSVVDMANYATLVTSPLGPTRARPADVVANPATGKIFVAESSGVAIIDAATNTIIGDVVLLPVDPAQPAPAQGVIALAVSPDGKRVFALTSGKVAVIDPVRQSVIKTITVDPSAVALAMDADGETLYVGQTGYLPDTATPAGKAGVTIIDALENEIDQVIETGNFRPTRLAVNPANDRLYLVGNDSNVVGNKDYLVFDPATLALTRFSVSLPAATPTVLGFSSLAFNPAGNRLYLGGSTFGTSTIPLIETDVGTGNVTRVLSMASGYADQHFVIKLATSFANNQFVLVAFLSEHLHHYPSEPPRRVVFFDGVSGNVIRDLNYALPMSTAAIIGDVLDPLAQGPLATTTTLLQASAAPPLPRHQPVDLVATVSGNQPGGKVVFKFATREGKHTLVQKIPVVLEGNRATLSLPACNQSWDNRALRKIVCSQVFTIVARYKGDAINAPSKSGILEETR